MHRHAIAVCTPIPRTRGPLGLRLEPITVEWHRARMGLCMPTNVNTFEITIDGREVGEARSKAVDVALAHDPPPEFVFFLDYDVLPNFDAVTKLFYRARCFPDHDILAGVYCCKSSPPEPLIYRRNGQGPFWDWTLGDLLTEDIESVHMGCTLIRTSLLETMDRDKPLFSTVREAALGNGGVRTKRMTEDIYFCKRALEEQKAKILVDTSVLCGHINNRTGQIFGLPDDCPPRQRAKWRNRMDGKEEEESESKLALDIGAGETRRKWDGYRVETTDIRPDCGVDYVMDSRWLNLPDDHYDLVASSHHLEHFGRSDQERVWREAMRVLKPGGRTEHVVPNIEWATAKIAEGAEDEHVYNVLYGAQEAQGYDADLNTHRFGYTPAVARAMAEMVELEEIEVRSYKEEPELGYNLIISGVKSGGTDGNASADFH